MQSVLLGAEDRGDRGRIDAEQRACSERAGGAALGAQPERPEQGAALVRALAVDQVRLGVAGLVVDRSQEERRVGVGDLREVGRLVVGRELLDARDDAVQCVESAFTKERLREPGYHQTVESMSSSSSIGFV